MRIVSTLALTLALVVSASAAEAARVFIIHGIPGVNVDVYATLAGAPIPATPTIANFQPKQIVDLPAVGPATVDIRIFAAGANPQSAMPVIAVLGAGVPGPPARSASSRTSTATAHPRRASTRTTTRRPCRAPRV
jgi:hypothetical protein